MIEPETQIKITTVSTRVQGHEHHIEYRLINADRTAAPLVVFLHEGLGSTTMWRSWPDQLCAVTGTRGLVFSRHGYGASTPRPEHELLPPEYMHLEARHALPALLEALGLDNEKIIIYGHSDGGSIALLYAAIYPEAVRALVVAAPHIFVEDLSIASIEQARQAYLHTDLPRRLGRYHQHPDSTFWGWNTIWLSPEFRFWNIESYLPGIQCPILAIQGVNDEYGTLEQIRGIQRVVPQTRLCVLDGCRHSPHKDQPEQVISAVQQFFTDIA